MKLYPIMIHDSAGTLSLNVSLSVHGRAEVISEAIVFRILEVRLNEWIDDLKADLVAGSPAAVDAQEFLRMCAQAPHNRKP